MRKKLFITLFFGMALTAIVTQSCQKNELTIEPYTSLFPATASEYAEMVESELGVVPTVILDSLVEIPLYQNGNQVYGVYNDASDLDNPNRFGKETVSGSAIKRYEGVSINGSPLSDVVWIAFLRNSSQSANEIVGSLQMIGYNQTTGATAFFESTDNLANYSSSMNPITFKISGTMPSPNNSSAFNNAFITPPAQCVSCHQADPFITNSFITAAKMPGTNNPVIPILGPNAPYYVIGGENWDMRTIHIEGNACLSCHRVGLSTVRLFNEAGHDVNSYMPPSNPGSLSDDYIELLNAWINGVENTPNAEWVIPAVGASGPNQEVGSDYLYQSDFNLP
jgi:hypothetical protein